MTNRERLLAVLHGDRPDRIPFSIYEWKIPWGSEKRRLRARGLALMRRFPGWAVEYPHCDWEMRCYRENGRVCERETVRTPVGEISAVFWPNQTCNVRAQKEFWVKTEADYETAIFMVRDAVFRPAYDEIRSARQDLGEDGLVFIWKGYSPLQQIVLQWLGIERYCFELADRPSCVWALYDALREREQDIYEIVAAAPVEVVQCCANPIQSVLGRDLFVTRVLSTIEAGVEQLHAAGKLASIHVDGDNALWAPDLARSGIDVMEALTPAPDTDLTMTDMRCLFESKILWANFPSSMHVSTAAQIRQATGAILDAVAPGDRFILGITEDIPPHCWRKSISAILDVLEDRGRLPLQ